MQKINVFTYIAIGMAGVFVTWFIFWLNIKPLLINSSLNAALAAAESDSCALSLKTFEEITAKTFLDAYIRTQYVDAITKCFPQANSQSRINLTEKAIVLLEKNANEHPYNTRTWIALGAHYDFLLARTNNAEERKALANKATAALEKALKLSPAREEIHDRLIYTHILAKDYAAAKQKAKECFNILPQNPACTAWDMLTELKAGERQIINLLPGNEFSDELRRYLGKPAFLHQLLDLYLEQKNPDYDQLIEVYTRLLALEGENADYYRSLAFIYREQGLWKDAVVNALNFFELQQENEESVKVFLEDMLRNMRVANYKISPQLRARIEQHFPDLQKETMGL